MISYIKTWQASILNIGNAKRFFIISFVVIVSSCSLKSLYNNLDYLIPSYVEGMVSLDVILEEKVEQRTLVLINWHRNTQLKQYAEMLRTFQKDFGPQLTEENVSRHISTMESLWRPLADKLNEEMAVLLPLLNAEQLEELFDSMADKNEEFYDEYVDLDEEERIEAYSEKLFDIYENWLGDLSELQEAYIEKAAYEIYNSAHLRLEQRKKWQRNIQQILYSKNTAEMKSKSLRVYFKAFNSERTDVLSTADVTNKQVIARLTVKLVHAATVDQKEYFINKTDDYIRIFNELADNR